MNNFSRSFLILSLCVGLFPFPALADRLDVYETDKNFSVHFLFEEKIPELKGLNAVETEVVFQKFFEARDHVESPTENNLVYLGIAYLYLKKNDYKSASEILKKEFSDNFILEDYRLYFLTLALKQLALQENEEKNYHQAVEYLKEAGEFQRSLYVRFPSSPFHEDVPEILTEIEFLLGKAYFELEDYPAAWSYLDSALYREFPGRENYNLKIHLALARVYEASGNYNKAVDVYIYLLEHSPSTQVRNNALEFLKAHLESLQENQNTGNADRLQELLKEKDGNGKIPPKPVARKLPKWPHSGNKVVETLILALSRDDFPKILENARRVLQEFPGDREARGILNHVNQAILIYVKKNDWNSQIDGLLEIYPVRYLNKLARLFWEENYPETALMIYQKIIENFPTQVAACHKAMFFMGRIHEDNQRFDEAIQQYRDLLEKYNWGRFTPAAQFKIPWLYRLKGNFDEARKGFKDLLKFANPDLYRGPKVSFSAPDDFRPAALYWLAQIEFQSGNYKERSLLLNRLIDEFPMDFYAMVARIEMSMRPLEFLDPTVLQKPVPRKLGLGEVNRRRLNRAEKLISIGFLEMGMRELAQVTRGENNQEFLFYLAKMFKKAGGFQRAIHLSWGISSKRNHQALSQSLVEILFPKVYLDRAAEESSRYQISPYLVLGLMRQESAFNRKIVSSARAVGLMQLLPSTAKTVARSMGTRIKDEGDLKKPEINIQLGVKYLSGLLDEFQDNVVLALASYNAGPYKVKLWMDHRSMLKPLEFMESIPYRETRNYVKKVLRNYVIYKTLYGKGKIKALRDIFSVRN